MKEWGELMIVGERIAEISDCIGRLAKCFYRDNEIQTKLSEEQKEQIYALVSHTVCHGCRQEEKCREYYAYENCNDIFELLQKQEEGKEIGQVAFLERCERMEEMLYAAVEELSMAGQEIIQKNRLAEVRMLASVQLKELSGALHTFSDSIYRGKHAEEAYTDSLSIELRRRHIELEDAVFLEDENGILEVLLTVRSRWSGCITAREVAEYVGNVVGKAFKTEGNGARILTDHYEQLHLCQDSGFHIFTGIARTPKAGSSVSGDTFSVKELRGAKTVLMLSDGMGSGVRAQEESRVMIELLEEFLEAGFSVEAALAMADTVFMTNIKNPSAVTADIVMLNLYNGMAHFYKAGAAPAYLKRGKNITTVHSDRLPAGMFYKPDEVAATQEEISHKLYEGDYLIMLTDGVLESLRADNKEQMLEGYLSMLSIRGAQEMADRILQFAVEHNAQAEVRDDMTVLVAAIYENKRKRRGLLRHG